MSRRERGRAGPGLGMVLGLSSATATPRLGSCHGSGSGGATPKVTPPPEPGMEQDRSSWGCGMVKLCRVRVGGMCHGLSAIPQGPSPSRGYCNTNNE